MTTRAEAHRPAGADCSRASQIICDSKKESSKECEAARIIFTLLPNTACAISETDEATLKANVWKYGEPCSELAMRLCHDIGPRTAACAMITRQAKGFPTSRCDNFLSHYDATLADLRKVEETSKPITLNEQRMIANTMGPTFGPLDAKVTLVVFSEFPCPFCARSAKIIRQVRDSYPSDVRLVFRQFPLKFHLDESRLAAEASLAGHAQGKYWEMQAALFSHRESLTRSAIATCAIAAGLDMKRFNQDLDSHRYAAVIDTDIKVAQKVTVEDSPTIFINDTRVLSPTDPFEVMGIIKGILGH